MLEREGWLTEHILGGEFMATISTRIEDETKQKAERIANEIGIPLSTAINVFIKRFVANNGFPFDVNVPKQKTTIIDVNELNQAVKNAILDPNNDGLPKKFSYVNPHTNELVTVVRKE